MLPTPRSARSRQRPAKSPSLILWRWGYVWLPIGSPKGADRSAGAPARAARAADFKNVRLAIPAIESPILSSASLPDWHGMLADVFLHARIAVRSGCPRRYVMKRLSVLHVILATQLAAARQNKLPDVVAV